MNFWPFRRKSASDSLTIDQVINRLNAVYATNSGISVTPENCEESPTVKAIITAVTRRFAAMPVHVFRSSRSKGRDFKEYQPNHWLEGLLGNPNSWQTHVDYWTDASSRLLRYGNFYARKGRGVTGPIRVLNPLHPACVEPYQETDLSVVYRVSTQPGGQYEELPRSQIHHARTASRCGIRGDSPIWDVRETIALEIAAEKFGATFFGNGAMPGIVFKYAEGSQGFESEEQRRRFIESFRDQFNNRGRFKAILPPRGIEVGDPLPIDNDKAQFIQLRQLQRTIIAGAFGVPPHLVGDLSKGTFNNVELQDQGFTTNVVLPLCRVFEAAMEKDLLTEDDRRNGIIIRFNPDAILRADFEARQRGQAIMRQNGVLNANEWRENENLNPISEQDGGEEFWRQGPSGQSAATTNNNNNAGAANES